MIATKDLNEACGLGVNCSVALGVIFSEYLWSRLRMVTTLVLETDSCYSLMHEFLELRAE
jgi:hypothetical protein